MAFNLGKIREPAYAETQESGYKELVDSAGTPFLVATGDAAGITSVGILLRDPVTGLVYGQSDGSGGYHALGGISLLPGGLYGFVAPSGQQYPLTFLSGVPQEGLVAGAVQQVIDIDAGSDTAHAEILLTFQATTGDPDSPSTALASSRFASPDTNIEVWKTNFLGSTPEGQTVAFFASLTCLHVGLRGGSEYTLAAGNVVTGTQMVLMTWDSSLEISLVELRIGSPTGVNGRYRRLTVTGYSGD